MFPLLQGWIDDPEPPRVSDVTDQLDKVLPKASDFLGKLPKPTGGVEPCKSGKRRREVYQVSHTLARRSFLGGLFKTVFSLVTCVIDTTNKIKDGVLDDATDSVTKLVDDLKPMVDALNDVIPDDPGSSATNSEQQSSSRSDSSASSSSSSCSLITASNCNIACTAIATTTAGGARRRADNTACSTTCDSPITKCGATGVTSTSTITSTTTTTVRKCAKDCSACNAPRLSPKPITDGGYLTDTNGLVYVPATTISASQTKIDVVPRETVSLEHGARKRALPNPNDQNYNGDVEAWIHAMVMQPASNNLEFYGDGNWESTSLTGLLTNERSSWNLGNMYGCTAVVVVSRRRIFISHIWENPTMMNKDGVFQRDAIDALRNAAGDNKGVAQGLNAFTGSGEEFENTPENHVQAFVIAVFDRGISNPQPSDLEYKDGVQQIKEMLKSTLSLPDVDSVKVIPYHDRGEDEEWEHAHGKLLVQYDPVQAMERVEGQSCENQIARLEIWWEETLPSPRYEDQWVAFSDQIVAPQSGPSRRLIKELPVIDGDEEEWEHYASLSRRQNGVCMKPSGTLSVSSTTQDPTTFQTSIVSTSGGGETTAPPSSTDKPVSTTTSESPSSTIESESTSPPTPTFQGKAVSIVLRSVKDSTQDYNTWTFFETEIGVQNDPCEEPALDDQATRWTDDNAINEPPWPHGTFTMTLHGEEGCQYLNDGNSAGALHCPSFGDGNLVGCKEDPEKSEVSAITQCRFSTSYVEAVHRVVFCEW